MSKANYLNSSVRFPLNLNLLLPKFNENFTKYKYNLTRTCIIKQSIIFLPLKSFKLRYSTRNFDVSVSGGGLFSNEWRFPIRLKLKVLTDSNKCLTVFYVFMNLDSEWQISGFLKKCFQKVFLKLQVQKFVLIFILRCMWNCSWRHLWKNIIWFISHF